MNKFKFLCVGGVVFLLDSAIFSVLIWLQVSPFIARTCALVIAVQLTFFGQRCFVIKETHVVSDGVSAWGRHQLANLFSFSVNLAFFSFLLIVTQSNFISLFIAVFLTTLLNYFLASRWVHKTEHI